MARSFHYKIRKAHRWMGVILGIQFLFWTISGLYFSWSNIDEVHGDHQKAHIHPLSSNLILANPQRGIDKIKAKEAINYVLDIHLVQILGKPIYQIVYSEEHDKGKKIQLVDAENGDLRPPLTKKEAIEIAKINFSDTAAITKVEYITSTNAHHEYREQPLPAFAITFEHPSNTTVYVSSELGTVQRFRNTKWRIFDSLWMLHTMDYQSRDDFSNWLLRIFSVFGLLTVVSGFVLYGVSRKRKKR